MKKSLLPNMITLSRVLLSFCLLFLPLQSVLFVLLYLVCGLTDALDGYLARKMQAQTQTGARLDSLADLCMCLMIVVTIAKQTQFNRLVLIGIVVIFVARLGNALFAKLKFKKICSVHTIANKFAGFIFFFCPLTSIFTDVLIYIAGIVALAASIEEFLIMLWSETIDLNRKSIFSKP